MAFQVWLAFFVATAVTAIAPGSGVILCVSHGLTHGMRRTSVTIAGMEIGMVAILFVAGAGLGAVLVASEHAFMAVKIVGALYLITSASCNGGRRSAWADPPGPIRLGRSADGDVDAVPLSSARRRFLTGLLTNVTNPKGIVFMAAVLPQFIDPARPLLPQLCILAATMVCIDLVVLHGYALLAERAQRVFHNPRALRWQRRVFGGTLMSLGAALFFMKRQTS